MGNQETRACVFCVAVSCYDPSLPFGGLACLDRSPTTSLREEMRGQGEHAIDKAFDIPWQSP